MPTEELKQALRSANVRDVDKDFVDLLCKLFDAPRPLVLRILYAAHYVSADLVTHAHWMDPQELPSELRDAISKNVKARWKSIAVRQVIERGGTMLAWVDSLVPADNPGHVCRGCPKSLDCVADSLSTPAKCADGEGPIPPRFDVKPIKIIGTKVTVQTSWPEGTYVLDADQLE